MHTVELLVGLLAVIALLGVVAERSGLPYPAVLVLGGIAIGLVPGLPSFRLAPDLVLLGFIPVLVYAGAFHAATFDLRSHAFQIASLATGFVLLTVLAVGVATHLIGGLAWAPAFVTGALSAPTDPVSASAVMGHVGAPEQITTLLEGESLINDGTGLAVYQVAVAAVGGGFSAGHTALKLVEISAGGVAIGLAAGWLSVRIRRPLDSPAIEIVLGLLTAFGSYVAALSAGFSGVLAAVTAGLYAGWRAQDISSPQSRLRMEPVWDATTFILQSVLFLMIGLQLRGIINGMASGVTGSAVVTAVVIVAVVIGLRFAWMFGVSPILARVLPTGAERHSAKELVVLSWSGMRGALSLAGALAIPVAVGSTRFPARDETIFLVYCVVLGTLIVPSLTLESLIRRLGLGQADSLRRQETEARVRVAHAALSRLDEIAEEDELPEDLLSRLRGIYELRLSRLASLHGEGQPDEPRELTARAHEIRRQLIAAQRQALDELRTERAASSEAIGRIQHDIDLEDARGGR